MVVPIITADENADKEIDAFFAKIEVKSRKQLLISVQYSDKDKCFVAKTIDREIMISDDGFCISDAVGNLVNGLSLCEEELNKKYGI